MSLKYLDEKEAEKICDSTLSGWIKNSGYKGCHSAKETKEAVEDAKNWAKDSKTARDLMSFVENSEKEILVVGMFGGYQCFDSTGTDNIKKAPVVYIDLEARLTRYVRQPGGQLHFSPEDCKNLGVRIEALDNRVALLHEFGHAKQWIENPLIFDDHFKQQKGSVPTPTIPVPVKVDDGDPLLNPKGVYQQVPKSIKGGGAIGANFAQAIQARATEVWGKKGQQMRDPLLNPNGEFLLTAEELQAFTPVTGYSVRIEADNIARHEWPICDDLKIPRRINYRDIQGTTTANSSQNSVLLKRQAEADKPKEKIPVGTTKTCSCGQTFPSTVSLGMHQRKTGHLP